jgi:putative PIN family toxin of toxin-antitoxin system
MRVVVDTNVFVSGIFWKGPPYEVLRAWRNQSFKLVISSEIFAEYQRVAVELNAKYPSVNVDKFLDLVSFYSEIVRAPRFVKPICSDPDDDKFLAAAFAGSANYIVTGDKALLKLDDFKGISILPANKFLKFI